MTNFRPKDRKSRGNVRNSVFSANRGRDKTIFKKDSSFVNRRSNSENKSYLKNNGTSLEVLIKYFIDHNGIIDKSTLSRKDSEVLLTKLALLLDNNIAQNIDDNIVKLNLLQLNDTFYKYSLIKIKSHLIGKHYLVYMSTLLNTKYSEQDVIIEDLKDNLKDRNILAEISIEEEKVIAKPIFYLKDLHNISIKSENNQTIMIKGVYQIYDRKNYLIPINIKSRQNILLHNTPEHTPVGSIILAKHSTVNMELPEATFISVLQSDKKLNLISMLSVHQYGLPYEFSEDTLIEAKAAIACSFDNRKDIRHIPLVTIDDEDAKDFDDAVFVQKLPDNNYKVYVAIADVSHYVKLNSALDLEAKKRGNSVYLPGIVIPMLPKELSNGWCSLNPNEDRGCIVMEGIINNNGELENFHFYSAIMKSHARLTYQEVSKALAGEISEKLQPLMETVVSPLYEVYELLKIAKAKRNAVEIHSNEIKIVLDLDDNIKEIKIRETLVSHKIIEELMICANIAAAKTISQYNADKSSFCIYRVHAKPTPEKLLECSKVLKSLNINIKPPVNITGSFFNDLLRKNTSENVSTVLNETILRTQSQAEYSNKNIGHFGLDLKDYCHFTSPIRRYSDLMVHRLILAILNEEEFKYTSEEIAQIAKHISITERLAFNAENSAKNRSISKWLRPKIGQSFDSVISSITKAGLFVNLCDNGASGLIPVRTISSGYAKVDLSGYSITDKTSGRIFKLGDKIPVILREADEIRGILTFIINEDKMILRKKRK